MIDVHLFLDENFVGQRNWPTVPRIGEIVVLQEPHGSFEVTKVAWNDKATGLTTSVHLKPATPSPCRVVPTSASKG